MWKSLTVLNLQCSRYLVKVFLYSVIYCSQPSSKLRIVIRTLLMCVLGENGDKLLPQGSGVSHGRSIVRWLTLEQCLGCGTFCKRHFCSESLRAGILTGVRYSEGRMVCAPENQGFPSRGHGSLSTSVRGLKTEEQWLRCEMRWLCPPLVWVLGIGSQILTFTRQGLRCRCWGSKPFMQWVGNSSSKFNIFSPDRNSLSLGQTYKTMKETELTQKHLASGVCK